MSALSELLSPLLSNIVASNAKGACDRFIEEAFDADLDEASRELVESAFQAGWALSSVQSASACTTTADLTVRGVKQNGTARLRRFLDNIVEQGTGKGEQPAPPAEPAPQAAE